MGNQYSVKWVSMNKWKVFRFQAVLRSNIQNTNPMLSAFFCYFHNRLLQFKFPETVFYGQFPQARNTDDTRHPGKLISDSLRELCTII